MQFTCNFNQIQTTLTTKAKTRRLAVLVYLIFCKCLTEFLEIAVQVYHPHVLQNLFQTHIIPKYSGTPPYDHLVNTTTSLL